MTDEEALHNLAHADERLARQAFDRLVTESWERLLRSLCRQGVEVSEAEEVLQEALLKHWRGRLKFQPANQDALTQWRAYVKRVAMNCYLDRLRQRPPFVFVPIDDERIPPEDLPLLESLLVGILSGRIYTCADALWLQADLAVSPEVWERRLIAASLYFLEGADIEDIVEILAINPLDLAQEPSITASTVRRWLQTPALFLKLAFQTLYLTNQQLVAHLLKTLDASADPQELMQELIEWHFGRGLSAFQIVSHRHLSDPDRTDLTKEGRTKEGRTKEEVDLLLMRLSTRLPFSASMQTLLAGAVRAPKLDAYSLLQQSGLWRRLTFQYFYHEELSPPSIVERIAPAAQHVQLDLNAGRITRWTQGWRLQAQLITYWREQFQGDWDE